MGKKLVLIGGGGHCKSVLSSINEDIFTDIIIVDNKNLIGKYINDVLIAGTDDDLPKLFECGYNNAFITVGSVCSNLKRENIYNSLKKIGFSFPSIIDKSSVVSDNVNIGEGTFIGKNTVINSGSSIGSFCIINTGTIVDHDCSIDDFVHLSPGVVLSGEVSIGRNSHLGTSTCVKQCICIGHDTTIGMGSVVIKDVPNNCTAFGNPCNIQVIK